VTLNEGDLLTLDGNEGVFYAGASRIEVDYPEELLARLERLRRDAGTTRSAPA
jgi:pyruvate,orthophosphate dikinase